jgi:hypothetical protein
VGSKAVWTGAEILAPTGIPSPDRPIPIESPYRLSYPGPRKITVKFVITNLFFRYSMLYIQNAPPLQIQQCQPKTFEMPEIKLQSFWNAAESGTGH